MIFLSIQPGHCFPRVLMLDPIVKFQNEFNVKTVLSFIERNTTYASHFSSNAISSIQNQPQFKSIEFVQCFQIVTTICYDKRDTINNCLKMFPRSVSSFEKIINKLVSYVLMFIFVHTIQLIFPVDRTLNERISSISHYIFSNLQH